MQLQDQTRLLLDMHWTIAAHSMPVLAGRPGSSFTFVTGAQNVRSTALANMNPSLVHGLLSTLRAEAPGGTSSGSTLTSCASNSSSVGLLVSEPQDLRCRPLSSDVKLPLTPTPTPTLYPYPYPFISPDLTQPNPNPHT